MFIQHDAIHLKIKTTGNYKLLTNSKNYEDMHRCDKHHIQDSGHYLWNTLTKMGWIEYVEFQIYQ